MKYPLWFFGRYRKMKRTLQAVMAFAVVAMFLAGTVSAATSQGLEWGIVVGDQWNFNLTTTEKGAAQLSEVIYMEVLTRPTIPNVVANLSDLPFSGLHLNITWANGTSLGWSALIFIFFVVAAPSFIVPKGNYTLLSELYNADSFYNGTISDTSNYWGMDLNNYKLIPSMNESANIHVDYLKADGVVAHWTVTTTNTTDSTQLGTLNMVRQGLPGLDIVGWIQQNILLVGIGVGVIVILGAVMCMKRK
jgi:hypothetical protein